MHRREIKLSEWAGRILEALPKGVLLTTQAGEKVNSMVIGWGTLGYNWSQPVFAAYIREGRFTRELLDQNPCFTVNIPLEEPDRAVLALCGGQSGRDQDKLAACGLHTHPGEQISAPAIAEFPLTLECRVLYRQVQTPAQLPAELYTRYYPQDKGSESAGSNRDAHITYFGQIVSAYILESEERED